MNNKLAYLSWLSISIVWGTTFLAIRIGVTELPPMLFAGFRWLIAGTLFFFILKLSGHRFPPRSDWLKLSVIGILMLGFSNGMVVTAEQWIPSGLTALMIATLPLWATGIESLLPLKSSSGPVVYSGLVIGFAGVLLIFSGELSFELKGEYIVGMTLIFLSMFTWIIGSLYSKYKPAKTHPLMGAAFQMLVAGSAQTMLGLVLGEMAHFRFTGNSLAAFLYLIFVASILGYGSYMYALSKLPVSFVMTHAYINPVIALFLGWLILDEMMDFRIVAATLLILVAVYLVKRGSSPDN